MIKYRGTNLSGGDTSWQQGPPVSGTNYLFVLPKDIDYLVAAGCNVFRLLLGWEALQSTPFASLGGAYFASAKALVDYATNKGVTVIIDIHDGTDTDFAAYYGVKVGGSYLSTSVSVLLADLWMKLATVFKGNSKVWFGVTNEPHDIPASTWFSCAQGVIQSIRLTGAMNKIVMPGVDWTGASTWLSHNAPAWNLTDPANNLAVQVHLYADAAGGGGDSTIASSTVLADRMKDVTAWARSKGLQVFVGEVGLSAANPLAPAAWSAFVTHCEANADVILGFTWWSYGPPAWWGGYRFTLCSTDYSTPSPQMRLIAPTLAAHDPLADAQAEVLSLKAKIAAAKQALT